MDAHISITVPCPEGKYMYVFVKTYDVIRFVGDNILKHGYIDFKNPHIDWLGMSFNVSDKSLIEIKEFLIKIGFIVLDARLLDLDITTFHLTEFGKRVMMFKTMKEDKPFKNYIIL